MGMLFIFMLACVGFGERAASAVRCRFGVLATGKIGRCAKTYDRINFTGVPCFGTFFKYLFDGKKEGIKGRVSTGNQHNGKRKGEIGV